MLRFLTYFSVFGNPDKTLFFVFDILLLTPHSQLEVTNFSFLCDSLRSRRRFVYTAKFRGCA